MTLPRSAVVGVLLVASAAAVEGATRCVNPRGAPPCVGTIQEAVNASGAGDVVTVFPGTYFESVIVPPGRDGLQISGANALRVTVDPDLPNLGTGFTIRSAGVTIERLTIRNGRAGVLVEADDAILQRLRILGIREDVGADGYGIALQPNVTGARILANEMRSIAFAGVQLFGGNEGTVVGSNTFSGMPNAVIGIISNTRVPSNNVQFLSNRIQLTTGGVDLRGENVTVAGNSLERVGGIVVSGGNPKIDRNRAINVAVLAAIICDPCDAGTVVGNSATGVETGVEVIANGDGLRVASNRFVDTAEAIMTPGRSLPPNTSGRSSAPDARIACLAAMRQTRSTGRSADGCATCF